VTELFSDRPLGIWALAVLFPTSVGLDTTMEVKNKVLQNIKRLSCETNFLTADFSNYLSKTIHEETKKKRFSNLTVLFIKGCLVLLLDVCAQASLLLASSII
jgi:hypothetical protein